MNLDIQQMLVGIFTFQEAKEKLGIKRLKIKA